MDFDKYIIRTIKGFVSLMLLSFIVIILFSGQKTEATINLPSIIISLFAIAILSYGLGFLIEFVFSRLGVTWLDK